MGRARRDDRASRTGQILLVALGAVAGLAIGMAVAERAGGLDGLLRRRQNVRRRRPLDDGWRGDERRSQSFDDLSDGELAPEAISHLHLREQATGRGAGHGAARHGGGEASNHHDSHHDAHHDSDPFRMGGAGRRNDSDPTGQREIDEVLADADEYEAADAPPEPLDSDPFRMGGTGRRNDSDPTGEELEVRVLEVFRNDPLLAERNIDIEADQHGRVELTGWVEAPSEVEYALTLARGVPQVTGVLSNLMIRRRTAG